MLFDCPKEIEEISFPIEYLDALKRTEAPIIAAIKRDDFSSFVNKGVINIGEVDQTIDQALFFFRWIASSNQVIENLNLVLADIRSLPVKHLLLSGSPKVRYYLLLRTFFYEFYRFREIHHKVVKEAALRGYVDKREISSIRKMFHDIFENSIELRNTLVHGSPIWTGENHFDLNLVDSARKSGFALQDCITGEIKDFGYVLKDICTSTADTLASEGNRMSLVLQNLVRIYVDVVLKA